MSKTTRRKFSSAFKSKVVLEVLKERDPLEVIAKKYELHPTQLTSWKSNAIAGMSKLFEKGSDKPAASEVDIEKLYAQIGQMKMENDFLKKKVL